MVKPVVNGKKKDSGAETSELSNELGSDKSDGAESNLSFTSD